MLMQTPNVRPLRGEILGGCKDLHSAYVQFIFAKFARVRLSLWPSRGREILKLVHVQYNPRGAVRGREGEHNSLGIFITLYPFSYGGLPDSQGSGYF